MVVPKAVMDAADRIASASTLTLVDLYYQHEVAAPRLVDLVLPETPREEREVRCGGLLRDGGRWVPSQESDSERSGAVKARDDSVLIFGLGGPVLRVGCILNARERHPAGVLGRIWHEAPPDYSYVAAVPGGSTEALFDAAEAWGETWRRWDLRWARWLPAGIVRNVFEINYWSKRYVEPAGDARVLLETLASVSSTSSWSDGFFLPTATERESAKAALIRIGALGGVRTELPSAALAAPRTLGKVGKRVGSPQERPRGVSCPGRTFRSPVVAHACAMLPLLKFVAVRFSGRISWLSGERESCVGARLSRDEREDA